MTESREIECLPPGKLLLAANAVCLAQEGGHLVIQIGGMGQAGMQLGRLKDGGKSKLDAYRPEIQALLEHGSTQKFIATRYHTNEANLSRWMKKYHLIRRIQLKHLWLTQASQRH